MLLPVRMAAVARLAAVLVAVTLSGAPRVLALHAPEEVHRCSCRPRQGEPHECGCALCHKAARAARAPDERAPPCHGAGERKGLADGKARGSGGAPCLEGTCGTTDRQPVTIGGVEPFVVPASGPLTVTDRAERRPVAVKPVPDAPRDPETPPPRSA